MLTISPRRFQNLKDYSIKGSMHKQKTKVVAEVVESSGFRHYAVLLTHAELALPPQVFKVRVLSPTLYFLP